MPRSRLTPTELAVLKLANQQLPAEYFAYLAEHGWGIAPSGRMVYSGPIAPPEVFAEASLDGVVLLGDDCQGYCFGFSTNEEVYGEISPQGEWVSLPEPEAFHDYVLGPTE